MLAVIPLLLLLDSASPAPPRVRLAYDPAGTACPARARLEGAVKARLGYDPFADDASETVEVQVRRVDDSLSARIVRSGHEGETGRREVTSPTTDCSELFRVLELAVAIAIDPRAGIVRPSASTSPRADPTPAAAPPPDVAGVTEKPGVPTIFLLGVGPSGSLGTGPTPTFGFGLFGGLRRGRLELGLGGRVELPAGLEVSPGSISTQAVVGNLTVCLSISIVSACALGELGALRVASRGLTIAAQQTAVLAGLGARVGAHFQPFEYLAFRPYLDLTGTLGRTAVLADGKAVWVTPPVAGTVGVAVLVTSGR